MPSPEIGFSKIADRSEEMNFEGSYAIWSVVSMIENIILEGDHV